MKPGESLISPLNMAVSPGYFEAMGIPMVRGRSFDERDNETAARVVIVDERLARHFWPNSDPVGRRMYLPGNPKDLLKIDEHTVWLTVVGVARTLRYEHLDDSGATVGAYYFPNSQDPDNNFTFALKTSGNQDSVMRALRAEMFRGSIRIWLCSTCIPCQSESTFRCPRAGPRWFWPTPSEESPYSWRRLASMACWRIWSPSALAKLVFV